MASGEGVRGSRTGLAFQEAEEEADLIEGRGWSLQHVHSNSFLRVIDEIARTGTCKLAEKVSAQCRRPNHLQIDSPAEHLKLENYRLRIILLSMAPTKDALDF